MNFEDFRNQPFEQTVGDMLAGVVQQMDYRFFLNDQPLALSMLTSNRSMLPAIIWNAAKIYQYINQKPLGVEFAFDGEASCWAQADLSRMPTTLRSVALANCLETLCLAIEQFPSESASVTVTAEDVRENTLRGGQLPPRGASGKLDHLVHGFFEDHARGIVPWVEDKRPTQPLVTWMGPLTESQDVPEAKPATTENAPT